MAGLFCIVASCFLVIHQWYVRLLTKAVLPVFGTNQAARPVHAVLICLWSRN